MAFSQHDGRGPIKVVDADGTNVRVIGSGLASNDAAAWSPDSTRIAFFGYPYPDVPGPGAASRGLYMQALDGDAPRLLISGPVYDLAWSPDGRKIAFTQLAENDGSRSAFVVDVESGQQAQVSAPRVAGPLTWSPDGSALAYTRLPIPDAVGYGTGGVVVARLVSGTWTEVVAIQDEPLRTSTGHIYNVRIMRSPVWLATGLLLYLRDGQPWLAKADGTERRQVSDATASPYGIGCVAPDGSALVLPVGAELPTEFVVVDLLTDRPDIRLSVETWSYDGPSCSWQAVPR